MTDNPIRLMGLDHVVLRVQDLDKMLGFYCGVLGLGQERMRDELGLYHLRAGAAMIDLVTIAGPLGSKGGAPAGREGRNMDHLCLRIADFDEARLRAHLEGHGIEVHGLGTRFGAEGDGPSLYVTDPEGNTVELRGPAAA
jgi:catechol 2,3-dioxygenase-like lactoylglutathione lyase family enzyme